MRTRLHHTLQTYTRKIIVK